MANRQKSRQRSRSQGRSSRPTRTYVAPVLDPTWQNPYAPLNGERAANDAAVRSFFFRRERPVFVGAGVVVALLLAGTAVMWWLALVAVVVAGAVVLLERGRLARFEGLRTELAVVVANATHGGGTTRDQERLGVIVDRLVASFGLDNVVARVVADPSYNATLAPTRDGFALFITSSLMKDFELIEVEGVVAHLFARERLGLAGRLAVASVAPLNDEARARLAGQGVAYRADEIAAATIRYPLGLAAALRRCAEQGASVRGLESTALYSATRWAWFNQHADRATPDMGDVDDALLRARALEEW